MGVFFCPHFAICKAYAGPKEGYKKGKKFERKKQSPFAKGTYFF